MARGKGSSVAVTGDDVINALRELREDTGCEGRVIIRLAPGDDSRLLVRLEAYTDVGTRIGVAYQLEEWAPGYTHGLMTKFMMGLHRLYHKTCALAHIRG